MTKQPARRSVRGGLLRTGIALLGLVALAQGAPQGTEASVVFGHNRGSYGGSNRIVGSQSPCQRIQVRIRLEPGEAHLPVIPY